MAGITGLRIAAQHQHPDQFALKKDPWIVMFCGDCAWDFIEAWMQYILEQELPSRRQLSAVKLIYADFRGCRIHLFVLILTCEPRMTLRPPTQLRRKP
jgi:hypothetical protein